MGWLLRVNLSTSAIEREKLDEVVAYNFLGGRGYASRLLHDEIKPRTKPLSPENELIFMTGPVTGTGFPGAGRIAVSSKSPLTSTIFDCSMGGNFGVHLKRACIDGLIIEGASEKPVYLLIDGARVSLEDASGLWGKSAREAENKLKLLHKGSGVAAIGPAGERLVYLACISSETRTAGRGGLGAVMGSKGLKAIVARGGKKVKIVDSKAYEKILGKLKRTIETHPLTGKDGSLARFGTALLVHRIAAAGMLPKDNFSGAHLGFDDVDAFSGETIRERYLAGRVACFGCPTGCGRRVKISGWEGKGAEFESIAMLGPNSGFYNYGREILPLSSLCDELGLDTISVGNILGFARAIGKVKGFENAKELVREIAGGESIFSKGVAKAAEELGESAKTAHSKGLELPAYDPRGAKGIALAYATSNRGGCHLRAYTIAPEILSNPEFINPGAEVGKARLVRRMQDAFAVYDSLVACKFHSLALSGSIEYELDDIARLLTALTGWEWTSEHLHEVGSRIYATERLFNTREGFSASDDTLPKRFGIRLESMLQSYYKERGWSKRGIPTAPPPTRKPKRAKLKALVSPLERVKLPQLQVALDMDADVETIALIAKQAYAGGARVIEAGTPAIKRHGVEKLLPALRKAAPDALLVADLKTMDVGNLEARIAFRAGADVAAVLAIGGRAKITEALSEAVRWDRAILIDLIDCPDPIATLEELVQELKGNEDRVIFCLHRGISEQLKGRGIYEQKQLIREAKRRLGRFPLFVAGGIKEGVAKDVAGAGAEVCIVGSAIYNSADPKAAAERILAEIRRSYKL